MAGYGNLYKTLQQNFSAPLFAPDAEYYKTKWHWKYNRMFENELLGKPLDAKEEEYKGSIYFFEKDRLTDIKREIE